MTAEARPPSQAIEAARKRAAFASQAVFHHSRLCLALWRWADSERRRAVRTVLLNSRSGQRSPTSAQPRPRDR